MPFHDVLRYLTDDKLEKCKQRYFAEPFQYSYGRILQFEDSVTHVIFQFGFTVETTADYEYDKLSSSDIKESVKAVITQLVTVFLESFDESREPRNARKSLPSLVQSIEAYGKAQLKRTEYPAGLKDDKGRDCTGYLAPSSYKADDRVARQWVDVDLTSFTWSPLNFKQRCGAIVMREGATQSDVLVLFLEKSRLEHVYQLPKGRRFLDQDPLQSAIHEARVWVGAEEAGDESEDEESTAGGTAVMHSTGLPAKLFDIEPKDLLFPTRFDVRWAKRHRVVDGSRNRYKGRDLGKPKREKTGASRILNRDIVCRSFFPEPSNGVGSFMDWYAAWATSTKSDGGFDDVFTLTDRKDKMHFVKGHWMQPDDVYKSDRVAYHEKQAVWYAVRFYNDTLKTETTTL